MPLSLADSGATDVMAFFFLPWNATVDLKRGLPHFLSSAKKDLSFMTSSRLANPAAESLVLARSVLIGLFALFFSSGALALIYEVIWQRQFALVFGSAAPATAAVLAAYFAGLGLGSRCVGSGGGEMEAPAQGVRSIGGVNRSRGSMVTPLLHGFERAYPGCSDISAPARFFCSCQNCCSPSSRSEFRHSAWAGHCPVLGELLDRGERRLGINAGLLYVANTFGAALGAVSVPFLFLPMLGANRTVLVCIGETCWWRWPRVVWIGFGQRGETGEQAGAHYISRPA